MTFKEKLLLLSVQLIVCGLLILGGALTNWTFPIWQIGCVALVVALMMTVWRDR